jgi:hypothetical protein
VITTLLILGIGAYAYKRMKNKFKSAVQDHARATMQLEQVKVMTV